MRDLNGLIECGYKLGVQRDEDGDNNVILYLVTEDGDKEIIATASSRKDLEIYARDNFEDLLETLEDYHFDMVDPDIEEMGNPDDDTEYRCEDCDSELEFLGCGIYGEYTAWCPCCGDYKSIY